jgi:hypothetical protein
LGVLAVGNRSKILRGNMTLDHLFDTIQILLYSTLLRVVRECPQLGRTSFVYNVDLLRHLCRDIANEKDSEKEQDLVSVLRAVIREDQEEIRVRMAFLAKKYANAISDSKAAD